jgi:hypothetical protein
VVFFQKFKIQAHFRFDVTVARNTQKIIAIKRFKIMGTVGTISPQNKIKIVASYAE